MWETVITCQKHLLSTAASSLLSASKPSSASAFSPGIAEGWQGSQWGWSYNPIVFHKVSHDFGQHFQALCCSITSSDSRAWNYKSSTNCRRCSQRRKSSVTASLMEQEWSWHAHPLDKEGTMLFTKRNQNKPRSALFHWWIVWRRMETSRGIQRRGVESWELLEHKWEHQESTRLLKISPKCSEEKRSKRSGNISQNKNKPHL